MDGWFELDYIIDVPQDDICCDLALYKSTQWKLNITGLYCVRYDLSVSDIIFQYYLSIYVIFIFYETLCDSSEKFLINKMYIINYYYYLLATLLSECLPFHLSHSLSHLDENCMSHQ